MNILKKNSSGFTLAELMVALGLVSVITLVMMNSQKLSRHASLDVSKSTDINSMIQFVTTTLNKTDVCEKSLKGTTISTTGVPVSPLKLASGASFLAVGSGYGERVTNINSMTLKSISTGRADLTINYTWSNKNVTPASSITDSFVVSLNVFDSKANPGIVDSCFSDLQTAIEAAVQYACQGTGVYWQDRKVAAPNGAPATSYGVCQNLYMMKKSDGTDITAAPFQCPAGEYLSELTLDSTNKTRVFKCAKFGANAPCSSWQYLHGIKADGTADCENILGLYSGAGLLTVQAGPTFTTVSTLTCPPNNVLKGFNNSFTPNCVDPNLTINCPAGSLVTMDGAGNPVCTTNTTSPACTGGMYITQMKPDGTFVCGNASPTGSCSGSNVVGGIDATGAVTCVAVP